MSLADRPELVSPGPGTLSERTVHRVTIVLPCYNEALNVEELHSQLTAVCDELDGFTFCFLFIDNASTDGTAEILRGISVRDPRVQVIVNARNFGHIRSPFHAMLEAEGDCIITMATDLQDPPDLIPDFLRHWSSGQSVVVGQKIGSDESRLFFLVRSIYYRLIGRLARVEMLQHVTGFGLYDRRIIEIFRSFNDPYPYTRGMITEVGLPFLTIPYHQPARRRGLTKNNFLTLFDMAMLAVTTYSSLPLRFATLVGFALSGLSLIVALGYLVAKLLFWYSLPAGYAPAVIGIFFLGSVQIFLIGLVGEYINAILTHVRSRPLVVERERFGRWSDHSSSRTVSEE